MCYKPSKINVKNFKALSVTKDIGSYLHLQYQKNDHLQFAIVKRMFRMNLSVADNYCTVEDFKPPKMAE